MTKPNSIARVSVMAAIVLASAALLYFIVANRSATVPSALVPNARGLAVGDLTVARGGSRNKPTVAVVAPTASAPDAAKPTAGTEILLPGESAPTSEPAIIGASDGPFRVEVTDASYDVSGKPGQGCATFDTRVPMRRLTLVMTLVNDTDVALKRGEWGAAAYAGDKRVTLCLSDISKRMPDLGPGAREKLTFVAFAPPDSAVTALDLNSTTKLATRVCFNEEKIVACASASK